MFLAGCAVNPIQQPSTPSVSPEQQREAFERIDWGVLQPLVHAHWLDQKTGASAALSPNWKEGRLELRLFETNRWFTRNVRLFIKPGPDASLFHVQIEHSSVLVKDDAGIVRFDEDGRMRQVSGSLKPDFELVVNAETLRYSRPGSLGDLNTRVVPLSLQRDVFTMPNGQKVLVSSDPKSEYQQLRQGRPLGMWEYYIGHSYIAELLTVKIEKDELGRLVLGFTRPKNPKPGQYIYEMREIPNAQGRVVIVNALPNQNVANLKMLNTGMSSVDRIVTHYEGTKNWLDNGQYAHTDLLRGDFLLLGGFNRDPDENSAQATRWTDLYLPITEQRILATLQEEDRREKEAERRRNAPPRQRVDHAAAFASGLISGFAQARQTTERYQQMDREFERNLNQTLRAAEQQLQQRKAGEIAAKAEAERAAALRANARLAVAQSPSSAGATPGKSGQAAAAERAQLAQQQRQAQLDAKAEQARQQADRVKQEADRARQAQEAEQRKKEAEQKRQRDAEAQKRRDEKALADDLLAVKNQIRLRALSCPGSGGLPVIAGTRPYAPRVANCVSVHYEARCPSDRRGSGVRGSIYAFTGGSSCYGDTQTLSRPLACEPSQAIVEVTDLTTCK